MLRRVEAGDIVLQSDDNRIVTIPSSNSTGFYKALSCERGTSLCLRNVIDFRNYKKFGADTSITFEPTP
jgi:hypothetical protein